MQPYGTRAVIEGSEARFITYLFSLVFFYTLSVGMGIQFVALEYVFPGLSDGSGLLADSDSARFHVRALEIAAEYRSSGGSSWMLLPDGEVVLGILSTLYWVWTPEPWTLLPVNSALHALAAVTLYKILNHFVTDRLYCLPGLACFMLFPSSLQWTAQIHQDGLFILGLYLFILACLRLCSGQLSFALCAALCGTVIMYITRAYLTPFFAMLLTCFTILSIVQRQQNRRESLATLLVAGTLLLALYVAFTTSSIGRITSVIKTQAAETMPEYSAADCRALPVNLLEKNLLVLISQRRAFLRNHTHGTTPIDPELNITCGRELLNYLPRATLHGVFAPFPGTWFANGSQQSSLFKSLVVPEVILFYASVPFIILSLVLLRHRLQLITLLMYCLACTWIFVISIPNVGSLYRYRWGFYLLVLSLGLATATRILMQTHFAFRSQKPDAKRPTEELPQPPAR